MESIYSHTLELFDYRLTGTGWAELTIGTENGRHEIVVSYPCDPLPELIGAVIRLMNGESRFEMIDLDRENTNSQLLLTMLTEWHLRIEVIENVYFETIDFFEDQPIPVPVFVVYTNIHDVCAAFEKTLSKIRDEVGAEQYEELWIRGIFPASEIAEFCKRRRLLWPV